MNRSEKEILWIRHGAIKPIINPTSVPKEEQLCLSGESIQAAYNLQKFAKTSEIQQVYCSTLHRAKQTAQILFLESGHNVRINHSLELKEWFPEELIGMPLVELKRIYGDNFEEVFHSSPTTNTFPCSESLFQARDRIVTFINRLIKHEPSERIVLLSHQTLHNIFLISVLEGNQDLIFQIQLDNLCASFFTFNTKNHHCQIVYLNKPITSNIFIR